jgi:hypothetical protein
MYAPQKIAFAPKAVRTKATPTFARPAVWLQMIFLSRGELKHEARLQLASSQSA